MFRVPTTHDVLTLFHPGYPKSHIDLFNLALLGLQLVLFFTLSRSAARIFFLFYFAFWRTAYDVGLAWVLTKQSKRKWIVREIQRLGWLDEKRKPEMRQWIKKQLTGKMGKDYSFDVRHRQLCVCHTTCKGAYPRPLIGTPVRVQHMVALPAGRGHHSFEVRSMYPATAREKLTDMCHSDFLAYCMFAFSCFRVPEGLSTTLHVMR